MPRFRFHIHENGALIEDEEGQEFDDEGAVRREALETGASIARDVFISGTAKNVVIDVRNEDTPFLKISICLVVEEKGSADVCPRGSGTISTCEGLTATCQAKRHRGCFARDMKTRKQWTSEMSRSGAGRMSCVWEQEGRPEGREMNFWLQAEREIAGEKVRHAEATLSRLKILDQSPGSAKQPNCFLAVELRIDSIAPKDVLRVTETCQSRN